MSDGTPPGRLGAAAEQAKGILSSLSSGIRLLIVLEERLSAMGREDERLRGIVDELVKTVAELVTMHRELEKRVVERFQESDRRVQAEIRLAVRDELERERNRRNG